jgi:hypothetical protein
MNSERTISWPSIRVLADLELRRLFLGTFWPVLLVAGILTAPLSLSPYCPRFLPALACGLVSVERNIMDMFGAKEKDFLKFVSLPVNLRNVILAKGLVTIIKAMIGAMAVGLFHAWLAWPAVEVSSAVWSALGFLAVLPLVVQIGASVSLDALRAPYSGVLEPVVRSVTTLLAGLTCAAFAQGIAMSTAALSTEVLFAVLTFSVWIVFGTQASTRALDKWIRSAVYNA